MTRMPKCASFSLYFERTRACSSCVASLVFGITLLYTSGFFSSKSKRPRSTGRVILQVLYSGQQIGTLVWASRLHGQAIRKGVFDKRRDHRVAERRRAPFRLNLHNAAGANGGQNLFEGVDNSSIRAQIVISSSYSDMVIASSQANDNHGSTLTFASYNPSNKADYRKWVINQGNWGARVHMLEFGYNRSSFVSMCGLLSSLLQQLFVRGQDKISGNYYFIF